MNNRQSAAKQTNMKDIPGYLGRYAATLDGKIYSYYKNDFLKPSTSQNGYLHIILLGDNGKRYDYRVNRLIAMTFLLNNNTAKTQVNHKDCNKLNNCLDNLEWVTPELNIEHAKIMQRFNGNPGPKLAYVFTNVFNEQQFAILGWKAVMKQFCANQYAINKNKNTGRYIRSGALKGLRVDTVSLKVQRLSDLELAQVGRKIKQSLG